MPSCPSDDELAGFLSRTSPRAGEIEAHVDGCAACRALLADLARCLPLPSTPPAPTSSADESLEPSREGGAPPRVFPRGERVLGRYVILDLVGAGGMGVVYAAYDERLDRRVALKVVGEKALPSGEDASPPSRVLREARLLARLSHPNIVAIHDADRLDGQIVMSMELIAGRTLKEWLRRAPPPGVDEIVRVFLDAGRGLAAAHAAGVVHRDFKPDNVLIGDDGRVRVTDFGLARPLRAAAAAPAGGPVLEGATRTALAGTPPYLAPEQIEGRPTDARSDQFAFSVSLYEAIYGVRPFEASDLEGLRATIRRGEVRVPPRGGHVPAWLHEVVLRGLRARPEDRFASMDDLCATLERTPRRLRRRRQALGLLAALAAVAALLTTFRGPERPVPAECHSTSDPLREAWSPDRRQAVHRAFLGAGAPRAREVWLHTDERLGEYARLLGDRFAIGCRESADGARPPEVLERVFTCLLERRAALGAAVQVLSRAEVQTTFAAEAVLATLPSLAACDPGNPRFGVEEMPRDPTRLASLREVRARLAEVAVLRAGGRYDEALERARPAVETAERLGLRWLVAEALYGLGSVLGHTVDLAGAERALERALWAAEASGNDALAQHAWHTLAQVVGWGRGRYAEAERLARHAESYAERLGADRTELIYLRGVLRLQQGQLAEARTLLDRSLAERRPDDTLGKARSLNQLAILWLALGDPAKALELANRTLALRQERLGPDHPRVAGTMVVVGAVLEATGDLDGALRHYERSLALRERVHGPQHRAVGRILARLASLCVTRGDLARADALFERTLAIQRRYLGATHPDVFLTWNELGRLRTAQGRLGEAQALYRKVLATARPDLEAQRAGALEGLGKALVAAGRPGEALPHLEEALELRARRPEIVDALAHSRLALARGLAAGGREPGRARALVAEAGRDPSRLCARCRKELSVLEARLRDRFP